MRLQAACQDAQPDLLSSGRHSVAAAAFAPDAAQPGTAAELSEAHEARDNSQQTARVAQALVAEASNQQREGDAVANRQGLVRPCLSSCCFQHVPMDTADAPVHCSTPCRKDFHAAGGAEALLRTIAHTQALLLTAGGIWAAAHRDAMLTALARISLPDVAAGLLLVAAVLR
jgi:hypothetical protein